MPISVAVSGRSRHRLAVALLLLTAGAACGDSDRSGLRPPDARPTATSSSSPTPEVPSPIPPPTSIPSPSPSPSAVPAPPPAGRPMQLGDSGDDVLAWQRRLASSGFWLGSIDGRFGRLTQQATWALEKAAGLHRDGIAGSAELRALDVVRRTLRPRTTAGRAVEVDLGRQLLLVVRDGRVVAVLNTSTGSGETYVDQGRTKRAVTPTGSFAVLRQIDGLRRSPLGVLWRPKYFIGGYAVHGAPQVPPWPASHGCVRLSYAAMDWIWQTGLMPLGTPVLVR